MAINMDNACYAVSIFNAIIPFKTCLTNMYENVNIASSKSAMREVDVGLIYLVDIAFLEENTFQNDCLTIYVSGFTVCKEDFEKHYGKLYSYIRLVDQEDTQGQQTFYDAFKQLLHITSQQPYTSFYNILDALKELRLGKSYTRPISLVVNIGNIHFVTILSYFDTNTNRQYIHIIDDGFEVYDIPNTNNCFVVAIVQVNDDYKLFPFKNLIMITKETFADNYKIDEGVTHYISWNDHELTVTATNDVIRH